MGVQISTTTLENYSEISIKAEYPHILYSNNSTPRYSNRNMYIDLSKDMCKNVHISIIYNFPKLETLKMFINNRMDIKIVLHSSSEMPHSCMNEQTTAVNHTDESHWHKMEWLRPYLKKYILQESIYIKFKNKKKASIILYGGIIITLGEQIMIGKKHGLYLWYN